MVASALARACHPLPAVAVTAITTGLAAGTGRPVAAVLTVAVAVLAGQLSVGWLNDLVDAPRDARVGRAGKPVAAGELDPSLVRGGVVVAAVAALVLSLPSGVPATAAHAAALVSAWAYDLGVKATVVSVLPYAVSFGLLPVFVSLGLPGAPLPPGWLVAAAVCLGGAAHFVNALPDLADDAATGVRGLPHRMGPRASQLLAAALVLAASALLVFGPSGAASPVGLAAVPLAAGILAVGLLRSRRPRSRAAFRAVLLVAVVDVALLVGTGVPTG
ncbi:4-hydroxybenzoate polyprenyltransferase [Amycolatopsis arida]|uniref:4-hydroxybenzoate polyprenyltransferase n=1 Tax=Amycolatopsis arida TaxID=587909 RepID=A0A1I6AW22_9PSEU|nr:4-hydroxybenzoate polyprenyltransferase [Amycolatopsis arida]SFQ72819.1 4-hydroxybenzoate polyprenyltransferase [Amycolatopsis arida]